MKLNLHHIINILVKILASVCVLVGLIDLLSKAIEVIEKLLDYEYPFWDQMPTIYLLVSAIGVIIGLVWQFWLVKKRILSSQIKSLSEGFIRVWLAFMIAGYGFAKVLKTQFMVPEFIRDEPMSEQHPFWLTWNYFGFSRDFALILAAIEVGGAILILFRKTRLLGAAVLLPAMANILLINKYYHISPEAYMATVFFNLGVIYLLLLDFDKLKYTFFDFGSMISNIDLNVMAKNSLRLLTILSAYGLIWMYANDSTSNKTFLKGVWSVDEMKIGSGSTIQPNTRDSVLTKVYFEHSYADAAIMEFNHHRNRSYNPFQLSMKQDSLTFDFKGKKMELKIMQREDQSIKLQGQYLGDTILLSLRKIRDVKR